MKILKWIKSKKNTYILEMSNKSTITLYDDIVLKYNLLLRKEIKDQELSEIIKANQDLKSYYESLNYLNKKMRSQKEVENFLKKKEYSDEVILKTINRLKKEGYINDELVEESFIHDMLTLTLNGPLKIKAGLEKLGINRTEEISKIPEEIWIERINKLIAKKESLLKENSITVAKQKLSNYLYLNGYEKELFNPILNNIKMEENLENLQKEKDKILKKLASKYQGKELNYRLRMKLYQKGYKMEDIEKIIN